MVRRLDDFHESLNQKQAVIRNTASEYSSECCCGYNAYEYLILCLCVMQDVQRG